MGWIRGKDYALPEVFQKSQPSTHYAGSSRSPSRANSRGSLQAEGRKDYQCCGLKELSEACKTTSLNSERYQMLPTSMTFDHLPLISATEVQSKQTSSSSTNSLPLWLVIDEVVFDCTDFVDAHPGGEAVIRSFAGHDCSWQFWRFHGRNHMQEDALPLRVGRTTGVPNPFKERTRFVGLRTIGDDDW